MFGLSRFGSTAEDAVDLGRDARDETLSRLDAANSRLFHLVERARGADRSTQRRLLATLDDTLATLGDRGGKTWKAVAETGGDRFDRVGRIGTSGLERLGLVRRKTWADRLGLTALADLGAPAVAGLSKFEARKLGAALSDTPVVSDLARKGYRATGRGLDLFDGFELPKSGFAFELPNGTAVRLGRQRRGFPWDRVLVGLAVAAVVGYFVAPRLLGKRRGDSTDRSDDRTMHRTTTHDGSHFTSGEMSHVDNARRHQPVVDGSYSLRGNGTATDGRSYANETARTLSAESVYERSFGETTGVNGGRAPIPSTPGSVFMPSPAPGASHEAGTRTVDADRVTPVRSEFEPLGNRLVDIDRRDDKHRDDDRDDKDILSDIEAALLAEPATQATAASNIMVTVRGGQATLRGTVPNPIVKRIAEERAAAVDGVTTVVNELLLGQHV